ncbi:hypothetical protein M422DRAFT_190113, partial [Sphaerobolus stellatus SS14]
LYEALHDILTLEEMCTLAVFSQTVSYPYFRIIRVPGHENLNMLELGTSHHNVLTFIQKVASSPEIIFADHATQLSSSFDQKPWNYLETCTVR